MLCFTRSLVWSRAVLPIVAIPMVVKEFCSGFRSMFKRAEQYCHFESFVTGLSVSKNRTIAGMQQLLVDGPSYEGMHHFMSESPWQVDALRKLRLEYVKQKTTTTVKTAAHPLAMIGISNGVPSKGLLACVVPIIATCVTRKSGADAPLRVVAIDSSFLHHTGEKIYGVYWYRDYAKRCYTLAQRMVLSTLVTEEKLVPLGWELYHRGFLDEQKNYLEEQCPEPDADESAWVEYDKLIEEYEQNQLQHKTQLQLAGQLVDECEQAGINPDAYALDAAFADPELMEKIDNYGKAWVSRLAKSRLVQTANGAWETIESFAHSLPKDVFKPTTVETRHGESRTYWCFSKCVMVHKWKKLRVVISYDNKDLDGEPIFLITNKNNWTQPRKTLNVYLRRDPVEHLIRDGKQELGLEDGQQRSEGGVRKHWELSFTAHTFLELGLDIPNLPGVPAVRLETIGQKSRVMEGVILQGLINHVAQLVLEGKNTKEFVGQFMKSRLNRLAT